MSLSKEFATSKVARARDLRPPEPDASTLDGCAAKDALNWLHMVARGAVQEQDFAEPAAGFIFSFCAKKAREGKQAGADAHQPVDASARPTTESQCKPEEKRTADQGTEVTAKKRVAKRKPGENGEGHETALKMIPRVDRDSMALGPAGVLAQLQVFLCRLARSPMDDVQSKDPADVAAYLRYRTEAFADGKDMTHREPRPATKRPREKSGLDERGTLANASQGSPISETSDGLAEAAEQAKVHRKRLKRRALAQEWDVEMTVAGPDETSGIDVPDKHKAELEKVRRRSKNKESLEGGGPSAKVPGLKGEFTSARANAGSKHKGSVPAGHSRDTNGQPTATKAATHADTSAVANGPISKPALAAKQVVTGGSQVPGKAKAVAPKSVTLKEGSRPRVAGPSSKLNGVPVMPLKGSAEDHMGTRKDPSDKAGAPDARVISTAGSSAASGAERDTVRMQFPQGYTLPSKSQVLYRMRQWSKQVDDTAVVHAPKSYTITVRFPTPADAERAFRHLEKRAAGFFSAPLGSVRVYLESYKPPAGRVPSQGNWPAKQAIARPSLLDLQVGTTAAGGPLQGARHGPGATPVDGAAQADQVAVTQPPALSSAVLMGAAKRVTHVGPQLMGILRTGPLQGGQTGLVNRQQPSPQMSMLPAQLGPAQVYPAPALGPGRPFQRPEAANAGMAQPVQFPVPSGAAPPLRPSIPQSVAQPALPLVSAGHLQLNQHIQFGAYSGVRPSPAGTSAPRTGHSFLAQSQSNLQQGRSIGERHPAPRPSPGPRVPDNAPGPWATGSSEPPPLLDAPIGTGDLLAILANVGVHDAGQLLTGAPGVDVLRPTASVSGPLPVPGHGSGGPPMMPNSPPPAVQSRTPSAAPQLAGTDISSDFLSLLGELRR